MLAEVTSSAKFVSSGSCHSSEEVYVSANSFLYYERGNPRAVVAPDVFVVLGVPSHLRDSYLLWKEPKGSDFERTAAAPKEGQL